MSKVDLHVHTSYSDGNLSLEDLLQLAVDSCVKEISITDHETIIHLKDYKELEERFPLTIIPGIEIGTNCRKLHIVGYGITDYEAVEKKMLQQKYNNEEKNKESIFLLQKMGIDIDYERVKQFCGNDMVVHRDVAKYLFYKGYVSDPHDAYQKYIGRGTKAYVPSKEMAIEEVLSIIHENGGISVLAHPFTISKDIDLDLLVMKMKGLGLSGIEIYPPNLTDQQIEYYSYLAQKYELVKTTGTDFHNSQYDLLGIEVSDDYLNDFHEKVFKKGRN